MKTILGLVLGLVFVSSAAFGQVYRATGPDSGNNGNSDKGYDQLHDQIVRCLSYSVQHDTGGSTDQGRVKVTAHNVCSQGFGASDSRFEITSTAQNGAQEREVGMFQGQIPPGGNAETFISVPCASTPPGSTTMNGECQYSVHVWWAATGGR